MRRLEEAARTEKDFNNLVARWDRLDSNRERRERCHEVIRSDVPLELGMSSLHIIFPETMHSDDVQFCSDG